VYIVDSDTWGQEWTEGLCHGQVDFSESQREILESQLQGIWHGQFSSEPPRRVCMCVCVCVRVCAWVSHLNMWFNLKCHVWMRIVSIWKNEAWHLTNFFRFNEMSLFREGLFRETCLFRNELLIHTLHLAQGSSVSRGVSIEKVSFERQVSVCARVTYFNKTSNARVVCFESRLYRKSLSLRDESLSKRVTLFNMTSNARVVCLESRLYRKSLPFERRASF